MGKVKVIKTGALTTIQDFGRFGYRRFGIPQSGVMDKEGMIAVNRRVGNPDDFPVLEFVMMGMRLEALEPSIISVAGAEMEFNGERISQGWVSLSEGDILNIGAPDHVYAYVGIGGRLKAKVDYGSVSTYMLAGFGGLDGTALRKGDILDSERFEGKLKKVDIPVRSIGEVEVRIMKGPEWDLLKELPGSKTFTVDASSNRMGIRLKGNIACDYREIISSAVVPGTIQLPADGNPIVLMNDCQTTGGYPRIGKVLDEDLGKLAQVRGGKSIRFVTS